MGEDQSAQVGEGQLARLEERTALEGEDLSALVTKGQEALIEDL